MEALIKAELTGLYGEAVLRDMHHIIELYNQYEGVGQDWEVAAGLDYQPTKKRTNLIKKLIKEQARFLFGKTPEMRLVSKAGEDVAPIQKFLDKVLLDNLFGEKLLKAARDCAIGKRVALKVGVDGERRLVFSFRNALEFVYDTFTDDSDRLSKVIFFYQLNNEPEKENQRIWRQRYAMEDGRCLVWEGIYDGRGNLLENRLDGADTGLSAIPVHIVLNDGLSGDLQGESDVETLVELQQVYNRLTSDDIDALKFNMFPQTVAVDAMEKSLTDMVIAPGALVDLQTDITAGEGRQASLSKLESAFGYDSRLENTLNRLKAEMHELLSIPQVAPAELKGFMNSGKAMQALYWQLMCRCEEKFALWRPALDWLCRMIIELGVQSGELDAPIPTDWSVLVENRYPLLADELEEKAMDMQLVANKLMSRKTFVEKWNRDQAADFAQQELAAIQEDSV